MRLSSQSLVHQEQQSRELWESGESNTAQKPSQSIRFVSHLQNLPSFKYYPHLHQGKAWTAVENAQPSWRSCWVSHPGLFLLPPSLPSQPTSLVILKHKIYLFKRCHQKQQCWLCNQCSIHWPRRWCGGKTLQDRREIREDFAAGFSMQDYSGTMSCTSWYIYNF